MSAAASLPYGSWPSPISTDLLTGGSVGLSSPYADGGSLYWLESRPSEQGRTVLIRFTDGETTELTPPPFNVRSSVHEYGGGAYAVADGVVVFSNFADGRLYVIDGQHTAARPITPDLPDRVLRYADLEIDLPRRRVLAVREDHRRLGEPGGPTECANTIVRVDLDAGPGAETEGDILVDGHDFVSSPRLAADGHRLAWYTWEHPDMPWDSGVLWTGDADAAGALHVDGGPGVSITDIGWLADGRLAWCSDRSGYWNLHVDGSNVYPVDADCAGPAWVFGQRGWTETADGALVIGRSQPDGVRLVRLSPTPAQLSGDSPLTGDHADISPPGTDNAFEPADIDIDLASVDHLAADGDEVLSVASFRDRPSALVRVDPRTGGLVELRRSVSESVDPAYFSLAEPISWPSSDGAQTHGFFYQPTSPDAQAVDGELPPLIVLSHGGPTAAASPGLSLAVQYWTTRGLAVLDVNYGGSTGYGREYRDRLRGNWGIVDVDDCCSGAAFLVDQSRVEKHRLVIKGGSAGGYTTLAALAFRDTFVAGVSRYGVGDLEALATDTHKFESRYLEGLVGKYPQQREIYLERSPVRHTDRLDCALLLLQGADDKVVPPRQSIEMADAVRAKGRPVALKIYQNEGHGFRMAATIKDATESELSFYGRIFGFTPDDELPDLQIDNLPAAT